MLRDRAYRLLLSSQAISLFGDGMMRVALAFGVLEVSDSPSSVGIVFAAQLVAMIAALVVGGVVADRTARRGVMIAADVARVASQGTTAALLVGGVAEVWSLAALAAVTGAATGFYLPASTGLLPAVVPAENLQRANGLRMTAMSGGEVVGPVVAGLIVAAAGAGWAIGVDAVTFLASALLLTRLGVPTRTALPAPPGASPCSARDAAPPAAGGAAASSAGETPPLAAGEAASSSFLADLRDGWRAFSSRTWVWTVVLASSVENMLWGAWMALGPIVADRELGGAAAWGGVLAAMGVGGVAGGILAVRRAPARPGVFYALMGLPLAIPLALLAAEVSVPVLAAGALVSGGAMTMGVAVWDSALQRLIPSDQLSRVSAYEWLGSLAFKPVGLALWATVAGAVGLDTALWLAYGLLTATSLTLLAVPAVRGLTYAASS